MSNYFLENGGKEIFRSIFDKYSTELHIMYYTFLVLWILSFDDHCQSFFEDPKLLVVQNIIKAMKNISREKLSRIGFKIFKGVMRWERCIEHMVDHEVIKVAENEAKKNIKDETFRENLNELIIILEQNARILSSMEKYEKEIATDQLHWGPCHTEKFWKAHVKKFEQNDFALIKKTSNTS